MSGLNKVMIIGNLGGDPEIRYTQSGQAVANFNVATSETFEKNGEKVEKTEWHRIVVWGKTAENCAEYLRKGSKAYVEGKLQTRQWEDKDTGATRYATEVVALAVQFLTPRNDGGQQQQRRASAPPQQQRQRSPAQQDEQGPPNYGDDDIPF